MAKTKQKSNFSDNKLFWMTVLSLLLSISTAVVVGSYIYERGQIDRLNAESEMKFMLESTRLKACYENDIKPCNQETLNEFNKKNYTQ